MTGTILYEVVWGRGKGYYLCKIVLLLALLPKADSTCQRIVVLKINIQGMQRMNNSNTALHCWGEHVTNQSLHTHQGMYMCIATVALSLYLSLPLPHWFSLSFSMFLPPSLFLSFSKNTCMYIHTSTLWSPTFHSLIKNYQTHVDDRQVSCTKHKYERYCIECHASFLSALIRSIVSNKTTAISNRHHDRHMYMYMYIQVTDTEYMVHYYTVAATSPWAVYLWV